MKNFKEPSFRESVDLMFNRAVALLDLSPGLEEKIRVCNATYTVVLGSGCAAVFRHLLDIDRCIRNIPNR